MENLILSFNVVLPLFLCMVLGYFLRRIHMLEGDVLRSVNKLCFRVFLPIYLFNNVYTTDITAAFNGRLLLFSVIGIVCLFLVLMLVIPRIEKENPRRGVIIQGIFRSNFALFGLPVALSLCGEENIGPTSLLVGLMVPVFNILAVVVLEYFRGGHPNPRKIVKGIVTNPLIISTLLGVVLNLLNFRTPSAVQKSLTDLGRVATPLSLVALGGEFVFSSVRTLWRQLLITVGGKLVISPLVFISLAVLMGFRNETLAPLLILFGAPTAVSSFTMAQQMDGDSELAAAVVVFTSAFSIVTIFVWIFLLKQMALL